MGVHPLSAIGRFPTAIPSLLNGAGIVDFELDPFDPHRVFIAGDDSRIKVYRIPDGGLEQDLGEAEVSLGGKCSLAIGRTGLRLIVELT